MEMTWQAWAWVAGIGAVCAALGAFTTWWVGVLAFLVVIGGVALYIGALMNTDI